MVDISDAARFEKVRLADLTTDGRFNRPVDERWVNRLVADFDAWAIGALLLSRRPDGSLVILDGQHRAEALRRMGVPQNAKVVPALVYDGLSQGQEAHLFVGHNTTRIVRPWDKYKALRVAGDPETVAIDKLVRSHGLSVSDGSKDGCIGAVTALRNLYKLGEPEGQVLELTLKALQTAWGDISDAYEARILKGVGRYFHEHPDTNPIALGEGLVKGPGAPINLIGLAKAIAGPQIMTLPEAICKVLDERIMRRRSRPRVQKKKSA